MPTPRRRSSRIRAGSATPGKSIAYHASQLASLTENEELPSSATSKRPANASSDSPTPRTPAHGHIRPTLEEMHPSKVQQSTAKEPDSGLRFGFADIGASNNQQTPSKSAANSAFEFRFTRPGPQLSAEAQKMMDDLREEALKVKAKLIAEREETARNEQANLSTGITGRKIAQPKGKVGRFSDIHMAEFKKMDSIADHPSAFRAQPGRLSPVKPALKRTQSQAKLDDRDESKAQSSNKASAIELIKKELPAKRARKELTEDTSASRPVSRDGNFSTPRKLANTPTSISTPTQASIARAATAKKSTTQIPSLTRSPSKLGLSITPRGLPTSSAPTAPGGVPKSEPKQVLRSPGKVDRLKSMLRYPSSSARKSVVALSTIPVPTLSLKKPDLSKDLPSLPTTPVGLQQSKSVKHVSFTPEATMKNASSLQNSPSPMKSGIPRSTSRPNLFTKSSGKQTNHNFSNRGEVHYPFIADHPSLKEGPAMIEYPSIAGVRPLPDPPRHSTTSSQPPPSVPGTFTFRSDHTINFGNSPTGFGASPGQSSVRQVRPSILPSMPSMPGSFPVGNKENVTPLVSVPHGLANKKRHRADSEDEKAEDEVVRSPKKLKTDSSGGPALSGHNADVAKKIASPSKNASPAKKRGLSLSRLNMLARPKMRK